MPPEVVFKGNEDTGNVTYFEAEYRGEKIIVAQTADGRCEISRLISTRPSLFLDPEFQPGKAVNVKDLKQNKMG